MGSLDNNGIYIYDETDQISPIHTYSNLGQASTSAAIEYLHEHTLIMPVANAAERNAYAADMAAAGRPASLARPLWVERADTGAVERNRGAGWHRMIDNALETYSPPNSDPGWQFENALWKKNGWVTCRVRTKRLNSAWSGNGTLWGPLPTRFRPPSFQVAPMLVYIRNDYHRAGLLTIHSNGSAVMNNARVNRNNWVNASLTWPTND